MRDGAFLIAGDQAAVIANDLSDLRYAARAQYVPVAVQVPVRRHETVETQFYIDHGTLEFMVGGAAAYVSGPDFLRIPAGVPFAYRNAGSETARLLVRTQRPVPELRLIRACIEYAA